MKILPEITFRNVQKTSAIEQMIQNNIEKLDKLHENIMSFRIIIEKKHKSQKSGNPYYVRINITIPPGNEIVVKEKESKDTIPNPLVSAIQEGFITAKREIKKLVEKQRHEVKSHPAQEMNAIVNKLFKDRGYGFLKTLEGREIYFHRNSVLYRDFDRLETGTGVRCLEEEGEKGLQASTVHIVNKT